ncbi:ankyrin repeat-containing domain protein [Xylaria sp. FL1042]|nr:ankyrin repeat-containing domain protein [Xylaria sp. FL1042]
MYIFNGAVISLIDLPAELLEMVLDFCIPNQWNTLKSSPEYVELRLVCKSFNCIVSSLVLQKLDRDHFIEKLGPLQDIILKWLLANELRASRRAQTELAAAVWNSILSILLWKRCNSEPAQEEEYFSAACDMLMASHGPRWICEELGRSRDSFIDSSLLDTECLDQTGEGPYLQQERAMESMARFHTLDLAAYCGDSLTVEKLLKRGISPNARNRYFGRAYYAAAYNGHTSIVRLLAKNGVSVYRSGFHGTPLEAACYRGHVETIEFLLNTSTFELHSFIKTQKARCLLSATKGGHVQAVKLLLAQQDIDVNARDDLGQSPLLIGAQYGYNEIVRILLERPDVQANIQDNSGNTALSFASRHGALDLAQSLLSRSDVDPNQKDSRGNTPLMVAIRFGQKEMVKLLLQPHSDPNEGGYAGCEPPDSAVRQGEKHSAASSISARYQPQYGGRLRDVSDMFSYLSTK